MGWYGLSTVEYKIMQYFWNCGETKTLSEVISYMKTVGYVWKQQTAYTVLAKLINKGVLRSEKKGNKRFYAYQLTQEEYVSQWTQGMLARDYNGSLKNFLIAFTGGKSLTDEQAKELHEFLDQ